MSEWKETGFFDCNLTPILDGDFIRVPRHDNACCEHFVECRVTFMDKHHAYMMVAPDGEVISGMGISQGFRIAMPGCTSYSPCGHPRCSICLRNKKA